MPQSPNRKLKIEILTIFPAMFEGPFRESLIGKARARGLLEIAVHDLRDFSLDKHRKADDALFGGGPGMLLKLEPIHRAFKSLGALKTGRSKPTVVYLSPQGKPLSQNLARDLALRKHLILLCGHYEGIDERAMRWIDLEVSIGDFVLTGGEIPAMALADAVSRMVPGVVKEWGSVQNDSFFNGTLDCAQYTRPAVFLGMKVPEVLISGNHKAIAAWRRKDALERTQKKRSDLLAYHACTKNSISGPEAVYQNGPAQVPSGRHGAGPREGRGRRIGKDPVL